MAARKFSHIAQHNESQPGGGVAVLGFYQDRKMSQTISPPKKKISGTTTRAYRAPVST
jgi:hypothetical protein